jgi:hypothetical protein
MPKRDNTARLADKYELTDLEPDVDPEKAAAFLASGSANRPKIVRSRAGDNGRSSAPPNPQQGVGPRPAEQFSAKPLIGNAELWTSRTIRLRQSTATTLTKAACGQKMKQAEGKLRTGEPVTVQEIADYGIGLVLADLGYGK